MKHLPSLLACLALIAACESAPRPQGTDETTVNPGLATAEVIDVAVLPAAVESPDRANLESRIRHTAHEYLIKTKNYAVPEDGYVDRALATLPGSGDPTVAAHHAGSDAVLLISITQWETEELLPKGRIWCGGTATLQGGGQTWWTRNFSDRLLIAPGPVTASNRPEMTDAMARSLTRDILSTLPPKIAR